MSIGSARQFSAFGGGGTYTFNIVVNQSGGSIDPVTGSYTAGNTPGTDLVRVTDIFNAEANAIVTVEELICSAGNRFISPTPSEIAIGTSPQSITLADFNNDGNLDFIVANSANPGSVSIRLGDGLGGFTLPAVPQIAVNTFPSSIAVGDFNNDGKLDFVVAQRFSNVVLIRLGDGQGGFTSPPTPQIGVTAPSSIAVGDINNDGNLDLIVTNATSAGNVTILLGDGLGGFTSPPIPQIAVGAFPIFVALGDFNNDKKLDFLVSNQSSANISVRLGDGNGGFVAPAVPQISITDPASIAIADFNSDGNLDFAVSSFNSNSVQLRFGNGNGGFTLPAVPGIPITAPRQVAVADMNNDGIPDLVVSTNVSNVSVQLGNGLGIFTTTDSLQIPVGPSAFSIALGDLNNDGKIDFLTANSTAGNASIRINSCSLIATSAPVSVSGRVMTPDGRSITNARIEFADGTGNIWTANSSSFGYFRIDGLSAGGTYTVSTTHRLYAFEAAVLTPTEDIVDLKIIARGHTKQSEAR